MSQKLAAKKVSRLRFKKAFLYRGIFTRVARALDLEVSHVRRVALGERTSRRVEEALVREIERIEVAA